MLRKAWLEVELVILRTYENKDELKNEINKSFAKYISEFNDIPEHLKDKRIDEIDRTPAENLAYQLPIFQFQKQEVLHTLFF